MEEEDQVESKINDRCSKLFGGVNKNDQHSIPLGLEAKLVKTGGL